MRRHTPWLAKAYGYYIKYCVLVSIGEEMSQDSESLGSSEKSGNIAKVQKVALTLEVNPYSKESGRNFEKNMTIWPPLEYNHFFGHFITYPGLYSLK